MKIQKSILPQYEKNIILENGFDCVVGIDEVGRGSWAGPVAVGAYIYSLDCENCDGVNDSKLVKFLKREQIYSVLSSHDYLVKFGDINSINELGIGKTIENLITEIVEFINSKFTRSHIIIDGQFAKNFGENTIKRIKADSTFYSVAAASILAKVERDRLMKSLHDSHPEYGFNTNVGYPTKKHIESLTQFGPCELHRKSFKPIGLYFL